MNIHITDNKLFTKLQHASLIKIAVGSNMYGINHAKSDIDYLYIYPTSDNEINSFLNNIHQLQYKEENIDHLFISLKSFITNCLNGDSTINFEVINSIELIGTPLEFLYHMRKAFWNYSIIRSYCGMARRDGKFYFKESGDDYQKKKLIHIWRGYYFGKSILDGIFVNKNSDATDIADRIRQMNNPLERKNILKEGLDLISDLRLKLNSSFGKKEIVKMMSVDNQRLLDLKLKELIFSDEYIMKKNILNDFDMSYYYNAFENWVSYE
jgi:predicted nucleotidyltransferase